ncbi:MAG: sulfatase-like hydrolase/transferase, partial [Planctomycetota bacterium]
LGCYGDDYAITHNIDKFATQGLRYTNAFTAAGVCAPVRSGIITAMYPTTVGTHQMRCKGVLPEYVKCFTEFLRSAGYYCSNNAKTDYQFTHPKTAWDQCDDSAHWSGRTEGQPFFTVHNLKSTHESRIRSRIRRAEHIKETKIKLSPNEKHDPAKAILPPYYPDTAIVRKDWAQYYDNLTLTDKRVGEILKQLEDDRLAEDTIVFFWGDHGRGLPRAKRWIYDSGTKIPLIIRIPEKYKKLADPIKAGTANSQLVSSLDFGPTLLSLAGVKIPDYMQGRAFLGRQKKKPRQYIFATRDRMDETYDMIRGVRDRRFKYLRNYMPHITYAQNISFMDLMPTMQQMRQLNSENKLTGPQKQYFRKTKPIEELYDTAADPHEINNLAANPKYKKVLDKMRKVHQNWMVDTGDVGLIPEPEFDELKHQPHWRDQLNKSDLLQRLRKIKTLDGSGAEAIPAYIDYLSDTEPSVRYWAVVGLHTTSKTKKQINSAKEILAKYLKDPSPAIRIATAQALCDWQSDKQALPVLAEALKHDSDSVRLYAITALKHIGKKAAPLSKQIKAATKDNYHYVGKVARSIIKSSEKQ